MKTRTGRIDDKGNIIEYVTKNYLYEIVECVASSGKQRGLIAVRSPFMFMTFLTQDNLIDMAHKHMAHEHGNDKELAGLIGVVRMYKPSTEVIICVIDSDTGKVDATAIIEIMWKEINLKGVK